MSAESFVGPICHSRPCVIGMKKPFEGSPDPMRIFERILPRLFRQAIACGFVRENPGRWKGRTQLFPSSTSADDAVGRMYARVPQRGMVERLCLKLPDVSLVE